MKRILVMLCVLAVVCASFVGCQTSSNEPETPGAEPSSAEPSSPAVESPSSEAEEVFLGFAAPLTSGEYWENFSDAVVQACEAQGVRCEVQSAEVDAVKQVEIINNFVTAGVDYLFVDPIDPDSVVDALIAARQAGVYVIMHGSIPTNEEAYDVALVASQDEVGSSVAQAAANRIDETFPDAADGSIEVAVISTRMRPVDSERTDGFLKITEYTSKATVVGEYNPTTENSAASVQEITDNIIQSYPDVKCFICYGDWAVVVNEVLNRSSIDLSQISVFGNDLTDDLVAGISDPSNCIKGTVVSGQDVFDLVAQIASGELVVTDKTYALGVEIVTAENVDNYK